MASLRVEWPKASLLCGTQVTRVRIDGGVGYSSCRTTQSCRHKALLSSSGPDSIKKDSQSPRRVDRSRQRQARLHTVGFGLAEGRRPDGQPTWGVAEGQLTLRYPSHKS